MTRRRSRVSGPSRLDRRRSPSILPMLLVLTALAVVACGGGPEGSEPEGASRTSGATDAGATTVPTIETPTEPEPEPSEGGEEPAEPSTEAPTDPDASVDPDASEAPTDGAAAACAGTDDNRDFFSSVASAVSWTVYCPVLGDGWFVDAGQYRLAGGGWLEIAYRGPEGARIELREGFTCDGDDCIPAGAVVEDVAFGDTTGTLIALDGGRYAVVVGEGLDDAPQWTLTTTGLAGADVRTIAGDLATVGG